MHWFPKREAANGRRLSDICTLFSGRVGMGILDGTGQDISHTCCIIFSGTHTLYIYNPNNLHPSLLVETQDAIVTFATHRHMPTHCITHYENTRLAF